MCEERAELPFTFYATAMHLLLEGFGSLGTSFENPMGWPRHRLSMPGDKGLGQAQGGLEEAAAGVQGGSQQTLYFSSSNIGKVPEYNSTEDFNLYLERLEQYFIANFIEEDRRVAVLLTVIGSQTYKILRDLCDPVLPKDKTFEDICVLLKRQFSPRISVFRKRIEFYEAKQNLTETINEWYARIKNLAIPCSFRSLLEEVLKDKFVTGLRRGKILDRLCEEEATKTMQELLEIAVKKEASAREQTEEVHKISFNETQKEKKRRGLNFLNEIPIDNYRVRLETRKDKILGMVKYYIENGSRNIVFKENESVFARDYRNPNKKGWKKGGNRGSISNEQNEIVNLNDENSLARNVEEPGKPGNNNLENNIIDSSKVVKGESLVQSESVEPKVESNVSLRPKRIIKKPVRLDL
ncbi:hypothetical protein NQ317_005286 [Molorchus minor]|uniref:Retrotransposon gag domain-containing protein n=1 Tax=Molorchus minor TaxID=1323400 RepID=A0ABQ9J0Q4_9CUCU|nr:hypothetical protein NQ317_005286 [Molorchus minor]